MKEYNSEKAVISMTSWKRRIKTAGKSLYTLISKCAGFHIVLVLAEEEFPNKENDLPEDILNMANGNLIEILWVKKNYKSYKKIIFTSLKYKGVPVISADDDCAYVTNYAEELYNKWLDNKNSAIRYTRGNGPHGRYTLFPPSLFEEHDLDLLDLFYEENLDDIFYGALMTVKGIKTISLNKFSEPCVAHDEICPINGTHHRRGISEEYVRKIKSHRRK